MGRTTRGHDENGGNRSHARSVAHLALVLPVCSCHREAQVGPARGSGSAQIAVVTADARIVAADASLPTSIDLLRAVPATIRVSSKVKNKAILPEHIADQDLDTAWNSATGDLVGAWVEVSVDGATIDGVSLTVGHTGHGPKGEDYFTMNPRIRQVKLEDDGKPLKTIDLDINSRWTQDIPVSPKGTLRITVTEIEPGSKKAWREVAISEVDVLGTPAPGWKPPKERLVPNVVVDGDIDEAPSPCDGADKIREAFIKEHEHDVNSGPGGEDHNYPPDCEGLDLPSNAWSLPSPWSSARAGCDIGDEIYGPKTCIIAFRAGSRVAKFSAETEFAKAEVEVTSMETEDVIPGGADELVVKMVVRGKEVVGVCRSTPVLACSEPFALEPGETIAKHALKF